MQGITTPLAEEKVLIIPIGLAGCGKTTFFTSKGYLKYQLCNETALRISADRIRAVLQNTTEERYLFNPTHERRVWSQVWDEFLDAINTHSTIYLDATNLIRSGRMRYIRYARNFGFKVILIVFTLPIEDILLQMQKRTREIPRDVLNTQLAKFQYPREDEYDQIIKITQREHNLALDI